jgi:PAS domain S-box-containing protein
MDPNTVISEQELFASIVNFSDDVIISKTTDGIIRSWNPSARNLFGYNETEAIGKHISLIVPIDRLKEDMDRMERIKNGERLKHFESVRVNRTGERIQVSISISPIKNDKGSIIGTSHILRTLSECHKVNLDMAELNEVLEQKVTERTAELVEANNALEAFSYSVSHDLRSPIRAISGFTKLIRKEHTQALPQSVDELLTHIENNSRRMGLIIDELLALAKYPKQEPNLVPTDMRKLFKTVWANLQFAQPHHAELELADLPEVMLDASMIEQVVVNLLSNAVKYSLKKETPLVKVGYTQANGKTLFYVRDNGAGFDMRHYDRLFKVFERLHSETEFEGNGIGLFLVKKLVEKHGGEVWAEAEVNEGATFYFTIPNKQTNNPNKQ